jgi:hypothetical protein
VKPTTYQSWPRVFVALLLACLLLQGTAVQTHVHFFAKAAPTASLSGGTSAQFSKAGKDGDSAGCLLCQQAAVAGAYLLPQAVLLPAPPALGSWISAAILGEFNLAMPARGWRSRAPPK